MPTAASPDPVAAPPAPAETDGDPLWLEIRQAHPEAVGFEPLPPVALPAWAEAADELWLRHRGACRAITPDADKRAEGSLDLCHGQIQGAQVQCSQRVQIGERFQITASRSCSASFPDGSGAGSGGGGGHPPPGWVLVGWDEDMLTYGVVFSLQLEPASVTWVEAPCSASSLREVETELVDEGIPPDDWTKVLHERYGVVQGRQLCQSFEGTRLESHRVGARRWGDMGAGRRIERSERDCTQSCPRPGAELRRLNAYLDGRRFRSRREAGEVRLFRTRDVCEHDAGAGLAVGEPDPCTGSWLTSNRP